MGTMEFSREDFEKIRNLIKSRSGIWLGDSKMKFLQLRLQQRLKSTNIDNTKEYYYYLRYDTAGEKEISALIDAVAVNETHFFREREQLEDFWHEALLPLLDQKSNGIPLTVWSAACSTGEEAYTLAMLLLEHPRKIPPARIRILASDISHTALQAAREGVYEEYALRYLPQEYRMKYFDPAGNGRYAVKETVKQLVKFAHVNLIDSFATGRIREMDWIFCRNAIIYFDDEDLARCINNLYRSLNQGGTLFLGHAESLARISSPFEVVRLKHTVVYRKPGDSPWAWEATNTAASNLSGGGR